MNKNIFEQLKNNLEKLGYTYHQNYTPAISESRWGYMFIQKLNSGKYDCIYFDDGMNKVYHSIGSNFEDRTNGKFKGKIFEEVIEMTDTVINATSKQTDNTDMVNYPSVTPKNGDNLTTLINNLIKLGYEYKENYQQKKSENVWDCVFEKRLGDKWECIHFGREYSSVYHWLGESIEIREEGNFNCDSIQEVIRITNELIQNKITSKDVVNHPTHYTQFPMELKDWNFAVMQTITDPIYCAYFKTMSEYLHRAHLKNGVEDIKKLVFWGNELIKHIENGKVEVK